MLNLQEKVGEGMRAIVGCEPISVTFEADFLKITRLKNWGNEVLIQKLFRL